MKNTEHHITPEAETLFEEFMVETDTLDSFRESPKILSSVSPISLLEVLNEAKVLIDSLQSKNQLDNREDEIVSRLTRLERDLSELKKIVSNQ